VRLPSRSGWRAEYRGNDDIAVARRVPHPVAGGSMPNLRDALRSSILGTRMNWPATTLTAAMPDATR